MRHLFTLIVLLLAIICHSQTKSIDAKYGFKEIRFDMNADSLFKKIVAVKEKDSDKEFSNYSITDPRYLTVGDCKLKSVSVYAFNNKVDFIIIKTENNGFYSLKAILFQMFGKGFQSNRYIERYAWLGNKVSGILEENIAGSSATFSMQSKTGQKAYSMYMHSHAKKGAADF